jgi:hypothetical protein
MLIINISFYYYLLSTYQDIQGQKPTKYYILMTTLCPQYKVNYFHQVLVKFDAYLRPYFLFECTAIH